MPKKATSERWLMNSTTFYCKALASVVLLAVPAVLLAVLVFKPMLARLLQIHAALERFSPGSLQERWRLDYVLGRYW